MNIVAVASLLFLWLPYAVTGTDLEGTVTKASSSDLAAISLWLYTGTTMDEYSSVLVEDAADLVKQIDLRKPTVFYIFGWSETPQSTSVATVVGAYLEREDHNVVVINWENISSQSYPIVALSAEVIGTTIATALDDMVSAGLDSSTIHIVSHSMGSQISGFIGRNVKNTLPRITALDPAGPGFNVIVTGLSSTDATFVDIIHTDGGIYGSADNSGTVDFFPNSGYRLQPGCPILFLPLSENDFCSHHRSWYFYAESLLNEDAFVGISCDSYSEFKLGSCSGTTVVMGYATPTTATGNVYLQTNSASPYGKEATGATYSA